MPIKIVLRDNLYCPVFFCDHCDGEIVGEGNYEWDSAWKNKIFFTHKKCSRAFGKSMFFNFRMSDELSMFCKYLQRNFKQSHNEDE